jgi:hypothetical protein
MLWLKPTIPSGCRDANMASGQAGLEGGREVSGPTLGFCATIHGCDLSPRSLIFASSFPSPDLGQAMFTAAPGRCRNVCVSWAKHGLVGSWGDSGSSLQILLPCWMLREVDQVFSASSSS